MIVTIHQPDFLPWLGFFDRWAKSDLYIVLDDVQFLRRGWHNRDKIKTKAGVRWLTVPVISKGLYFQHIRDVRIDNETNWRRKHLGTIKANYREAPNFERCFRKIEEIYSEGHRFILDLNLDLLRFAAGELGIATPFVLASTLDTGRKSTERLVELVKAVGGTVYMTGQGSKAYLDEQRFCVERIRVLWQEFEHPAYGQLHGDFVPMLSVMDFLMMRGANKDARRASDIHSCR